MSTLTLVCVFSPVLAKIVHEAQFSFSDLPGDRKAASQGLPYFTPNKHSRPPMVMRERNIL